MSQKNRSFLSDALHSGVTRFALILFGLASSVLIARGLGPENRGILAVLMAVPQVLLALAEGGVRQATAVLLSKDEKSVESVRASAYVYTLAMSLLGFIVAVLALKILYPVIAAWQSSVLASLVIPLTLFLSAQQGASLAKRDVRSYNYTNLLPRVLTVGLLFVFYVTNRISIDAVLLVSCVGIFAVVLYTKISAISAGQRILLKKANLECVGKLWRLGVVFSISLFVISGSYKLTALLLGAMSSYSAAGEYTVAAQIAELLWNVPAIMMVAVFARSLRSGANSREYIQSLALLCRLCLFAVFAAGLVIALMGRFFFATLFGEEFGGTAYVYLALLPGIVLFVPFKVLNSHQAASGKPVEALFSVVPGIFVSVILVYSLSQSYGAVGAAVGSGSGFALSGLITAYRFAKMYDIPFSSLLVSTPGDFAKVYHRFAPGTGGKE